jgi:hypothetical protein
MRTKLSAVLRAYVSGSILVTAYVAAADPGSQHAFAMQEDGYGGFFAIGLMAVVSLAGILDAVINDFMPDRYAINCTHRHRHVVFMLSAIGQIALILALVRVDELKPSAARYLLDAGFATWVAIAGVLAHARETRKSATAARERDRRVLS